MKKILLLIGLLLLIIELNAHGACLIENLKKESACTGGASGINNIPPDNSTNNTDREQLNDSYKIPTMSTPKEFNNGYPMLNQNCMFGFCLPKE